MDQEIIYSCLETRNREYYRNVQKVSEQIKVDIYIYIYLQFSSKMTNKVEYFAYKTFKNVTNKRNLSEKKIFFLLFKIKR